MLWLQISMAMENRGRQLPAIAGNCHSTGNCRQSAPSDARSGVKSQGTKCSRVRVGVGGRSKGQYLALEGATNKSDWVRVGGCIILITSHPLPRGLGFNDGPDRVTRFSTGGVGVIVGNAFSSLRGDR